MQSRRNFVASSATALLAAATPRMVHGQILGGQSAGARSTGDLFSNGNVGALSSGQFTEAGLQPLVGTLFMLFVDDLKVDYMRLLEVADSSPTTAAPQNSAAKGSLARLGGSQPVLQQFTMIFGNQRALPAQGSYLLDHGTLGRFTLFLVPGESSSGAPRSKAYFSLLGQAVQPIATGPTPR